MNTLSLKIEQFYTAVYSRLSFEYQGYSYKEVALTEIAVKFYLNEFINNTTFFKELEAIDTNEQWDSMITSYVNQFEVKVSSIQKVIYSVLDCVRYIKYQLTKRVSFTTPEYYFFITNKKFINYTASLRDELKNRGISCGLLLWDTNDVNAEIKTISNTPTVAFPKFWIKNYFQFRSYNNLVDRVLGYKSLRKAKKIILVEGCVLSEHIVAEVCNTKKIKNDCIQWGFFAKTVTQAGWRNMPFNKFIVWGDFFKRHFQKYNSLPIVAIGHPTLNSIENKEQEKIVLFAVQKIMGEYIIEKDLYKFIDFAINFASKNFDYRVIIRSHPDYIISNEIKQKANHLENIIWHDYQNVSLNESFKRAKYCVSISSSVSLESLSYNCYPIFIKVKPIPLQMHEIFESTDNFSHTFDYENFDDNFALLEKTNSKEYLANLKLDFYKSFGSKAIKEITKEILAA